MRFSKGDWVKYRCHEGFCVTHKVLDIRPDDVLIVGEHDNDPEPNHIGEDDVIDVL